ncbi:acyl CoA:acetate/3-ketoacid CoA transferase [Cellulomonas sp.]|uniref:acyl CoA:acetate/3-ketoacid CoA transferase n=1 Tax=Cellulomonas sp. TaxID=40001 RepID=UPI003BAB41E5
MSALEAAALIADGATVTVSSSSGLGCPDAVLQALGELFATTGSPADLTTVHPIAAGDMYGVKGIDHIAAQGQLRRVIAGSFPSGPSSMEPPLIWRRIADDNIEAWNLPSGVIFQQHRAGATGQPAVVTTVGLDTFIDPRHEGGALTPSTPRDLISVVEHDGREYLSYPPIRPDVAIIRATTADEHGNLTYEHEGSPLGALDQAYAAHNNGGVVIAQVKRLVKAGTIPPQRVQVPGILVDVVVVAPDQLQTTQTLYDPALSGEIFAPDHHIEPLDFGLEKIITRRAAMELQPGWIVNLGFGVSAGVPRILQEEGLGESITWVLEQGPVGGFPLTGFAFGCALNPDAIMQSADQFTLLQGGGINAAMLSFLEIDRFGNVNVSYLPSRLHVTAGVGGFADIVNGAQKIVFAGYFTAGSKDIAIGPDGLEIRSDGKVAKLTQDVARVTFSGKQALAAGKQITYVTERAVLELRAEGVTVIEIAPGVDLQRDVLDKAKFPLLVADNLKVMDSRLFDKAPMGLHMHGRES